MPYVPRVLHALISHVPQALRCSCAWHASCLTCSHALYALVSNISCALHASVPQVPCFPHVLMPNMPGTLRTVVPHVLRPSLISYLRWSYVPCTSFTSGASCLTYFHASDFSYLLCLIPIVLLVFQLFQLFCSIGYLYWRKLIAIVINI